MKKACWNYRLIRDIIFKYHSKWVHGIFTTGRNTSGCIFVYKYQPNIFDKYTSTVFWPVVKMAMSHIKLLKSTFIKQSRWIGFCIVILNVNSNTYFPKFHALNIFLLLSFNDKS